MSNARELSELGSIIIVNDGNVGIGTSSPDGKVASQVNFGNGSASNYLAQSLGTAQGQRAGYSFRTTFEGTGDNNPRRSADIWSGFGGGAWGHEFLAFGVGSNGSSNDTQDQTSEKMRILSGGEVNINTTGNTNARLVVNGATKDAIRTIRSGTSSSTQISFANLNGVVGTISTSGSSTTYATSSDYRLKENIVPMAGALDVIQQLRPVTYTWKADGSPGQGFIAHELQAVVPECVTGEKDAVDDEGNPVYQGMDTSFLVATLTKAIQELKAELDEAKARIGMLEAA
jgi:hypothetical protein